MQIRVRTFMMAQQNQTTIFILSDGMIIIQRKTLMEKPRIMALSFVEIVGAAGSARMVISMFHMKIQTLVHTMKSTLK